MKAFPSACVRDVADFEYDRPVEVLVGKRVDKNVVDNAENHGGRSDTKGEREDSNGREAGTLAERADRRARVLEKGFEK